jgi:hypothetical protein
MRLRRRRKYACGRDDPQTIRCDAKLPGGTACGQPAIIHGTHHEYASNFGWERGGSFEHALVETRYDIECPRCGRRTQIPLPKVDRMGIAPLLMRGFAKTRQSSCAWAKRIRDCE